jgi:ppGpp synthetase/RelA/SpoT-type nucleotidyltranferase
MDAIKAKVSQITVPDTIRDDMMEIIQGPLNRCGIYHRIFFRVKKPDSIVSKLTNVKKNYNEYHKMQDLIGIRIVLYYVDDLKICKDLIEREFPECEWAVSNQTTSEFKSMKTNGVMMLPKYIADRISPQTWELPIDKTFEVQIRTMAFEGWHEIEHDMRYKYTKMWETDNSKHYARKLNSVLATLELCDDSIISMLDEMGHTYYKECDWNSMIRCHYHLKMNQNEMDSELKEALDRDTSIGKYIYKLERSRFIMTLMDNYRDIELGINSIVGIINEQFIHDKDVTEIVNRKGFLREKVYEPANREKALPVLTAFNVFKSTTYLKGSDVDPEVIFTAACNIIHKWILEKYENIFPDIPQSAETFTMDTIGYKVNESIDWDELLLSIEVTHPDAKEACKLWSTKAKIYPSGNRLVLWVRNDFHELETNHGLINSSSFSRPSFYGRIAGKLGIVDVDEMRTQVVKKSGRDFDDVMHLINSPSRRFPVVVIAAKDGEWLRDFKEELFAKKVSYYAHVLLADQALSDELSAQYSEKPDTMGNSIRIFWPNGTRRKCRYQSYPLEYMQQCSFEMHSLKDNADTRYRNISGAGAFRFRLVAAIREENVSE